MEKWPGGRGQVIGSTRHSDAIELLIRNWRQFAPLKEDHLGLLRQLPLSIKEYKRDAAIATLDLEAMLSFLVISGNIFRHKVMPNGARQILAMHFPGDIVNLDGLVFGASRHTIVAAGPSLVATIQHGAIAHMLASQPDLARWVMWEIARDAANAREWLAVMGRQLAYQQIAHLICELYFRMRWAGQLCDQTLGVDLYQGDLGDICGISSVHVNRSLQVLRKERLIAVRNHQIAVRDIEALAHVAMFDPSYLQPFAPDTLARSHSPCRDASPDSRPFM